MTPASLIYTLLTGALGLVVAGSVAYLLALLLAAVSRPRRALAVDDRSGRPLRLAVVIPAHDEEPVLAATLASLRAQEYPAALFEVVVVADNCSDATAAIARTAGAMVLERFDPVRRGKGYALDWALARLLAGARPADAFVVVDADTLVAPDFLARMAARIAASGGALGFCALQGRYGVLNASEGWRSTLMAAAFDLFNHLRPLGCERLGLAVGLKGNGMAFSRGVLERARWSGESVTEDIDFGLDLLRDLGLRVAYVPEARVLAQMPTTAAQATSQRARWEGGRGRLLRQRALPLFRDGLRRRDLCLCHAAVELALPPLAELAALLLIWGGTIAAGQWTGWLAAAAGWRIALGGAAFGLAVYVLGGFYAAGAPRAAYLVLLLTPFYSAWKLALQARRMVGQRAPGTAGGLEWVRTQRTRIPAAGAPEAVETPVSAHSRIQ